MSTEADANYQAARRAYELGRLRSGAWQAALITTVVAAFGVLTSGSAALMVLPITAAAWLLAFWRGDAFLRGAVHGLMGGLLTSLLPMSVLRPCCAAGAAKVVVSGATCCTMPGACLGAGAVVGLVLATVVPFGKAAWWKTATGVSLGVASVAILKCTTLFAGEAFGLVGGLLAGVAAATAAKAVAQRRLTRAPD
jgi:hypothetical protein